MENPKYFGFTCAYTPVQLIHAAGYVPYRILPLGQAPDRAGRHLHDNLCPHVKQVLDRVLARDHPDLAAIVVMNSCESMRRLADALNSTSPDIPVVLVDLPSEINPRNSAYFVSELQGLQRRLEELAGAALEPAALSQSLGQYNQLIQALDSARNRVGAAAMQDFYNLSVTADPQKNLEKLQALDGEHSLPLSGVPVFLFGNLLCDPGALELMTEAGCRVMGDDLCTGRRQLTVVDPIDSLGTDADPLTSLAKALLNRAPCARTVCAPPKPHLAEGIIKQIQKSGARGAIAHVLKFCDPYLARLPAIREALRAQQIPMLILEGDGTLGAFGQQRTRIEAFVETLGGGPG